MLMEPASAAPADRRWAGFMKWTQSTVCADGSQGRGWDVRCSIAPLLPSLTPLPEWKGAPAAYCMRILQALVHAEYDFDLEGISMSAFRQTLHDAVRQNAQLMEEHCWQPLPKKLNRKS